MADEGPVEERAIHVLVVDDSAVVRQTVSTLLGSAGGITVAVAADPLIAMNKMRQARPDVIVLDIEMPRMDGLTFLRKIMTEDPIPVVICSSLTGEGSEATLTALQLGAIDVVLKPKVRVGEFLTESAVRLIEAVRAGAEARLGNRSSHREMEPVPGKRWSHLGERLIVIGASTGGTEALRTILDGMPESSPPIAIVQHMPERFTAAFARRLNETSPMNVREALHGDGLLPGTALIAPGNHHLAVSRDATGQLRVDVLEGPLVNRHRPSVDVLFASTARVVGTGAVGVILTGMGADGAAGLLKLRTAGGRTLAQNEASSIVFGMPGAAIRIGAALEVVPLTRMPHAILNAAAGLPGRGNWLS